MTNEIIKQFDNINGKKIDVFIESECFHGSMLEGKFGYELSDEIFTTFYQNENGKTNDDFIFWSNDIKEIITDIDENSQFSEDVLFVLVFNNDVMLQFFEQKSN